jgi:hypothetical protein
LASAAPYQLGLVGVPGLCVAFWMIVAIVVAQHL